jgi:hypothetical protein
VIIGYPTSLDPLIVTLGFGVKPLFS